MSRDGGDGPDDAVRRVSVLAARRLYGVGRGHAAE